MLAANERRKWERLGKLLDERITEDALRLLHTHALFRATIQHEASELLEKSKNGTIDEDAVTMAGVRISARGQAVGQRASMLSMAIQSFPLESAANTPLYVEIGIATSDLSQEIISTILIDVQEATRFAEPIDLDKVFEVFLTVMNVADYDLAKLTELLFRNGFLTPDRSRLSDEQAGFLTRNADAFIEGMVARMTVPEERVTPEEWETVLSHFVGNGLATIEQVRAAHGFSDLDRPIVLHRGTGREVAVASDPEEPNAESFPEPASNRRN